MTEKTELEQLAEQFPSWHFGSVWATANSGPDAKRLTASKGRVLLTAWNRYELAADIRREENNS
jgi:hypothetical protein